jgi:hypothetical protein
MAPETKKRYAAERVADICNRIEGVPVSMHAQELSRQWVHGQISGDEMIPRLVEQHRRTE